MFIPSVAYKFNYDYYLVKKVYMKKYNFYFRNKKQLFDRYFI